MFFSFSIVFMCNSVHIISKGQELDFEKFGALRSPLLDCLLYNSLLCSLKDSQAQVLIMY